MRSPFMFSAAFVALAATYISWFNVVVRTDPDAAMSRFEALWSSGEAKRAVPYGERVLKMRREGGISEEALAPLKADLASAEIKARKYSRGASLMEQALSSSWADSLSASSRAAMEDNLAHAHILAGEVDKATAIYFAFLELAGDQASGADDTGGKSPEGDYAARILGAADLFAESLKLKGGGELIKGSPEARLATASQMGALGAFYSMHEEGVYAAAGLLSSAYEIRRDLLGAENQATVQIALLLGPVFADMGRLADAEALYLEAFHAQEKLKGANSPDLSLYIKLLAGIYERQGRATEAQALYEHMRSLFRDAFGAQRYAVNRARDRRTDINRPVSQYFLMPADYAPTDLISAADFSVPLSKAEGIDEMKLRLAADIDADDPREANLPVRLAQLISLCSSESGERITLRSGYRSYKTQRELYDRIGYLGTVTPPGMSEHQTGLAADVDVNGRFMRRSDSAYHCFEENGFQFGFILSYPQGNDYLPGVDSYEPWHWRYVGVPTARLYREAGPIDKPQEFLAALPCYEERAAAGIFPNAGEQDVCLAESGVVSASTESKDPETAKASTKAARKLNNARQGARTR
ncbi:MAG: D-alanyl-D-alanine carboxypeptidase family protein [Caulobacterales bacterium]|nr:D-alanyl-D-alanine carboxypeptidase family protein [Caulobacterales bacterium]